MDHLSRREFITLTTATLMTTDLFSNFAKPLAGSPSQGYQALIFATNWGYVEGWEAFCKKIKALGYDGAEFWYPSDVRERTMILDLFAKHSLKYGFLIGSGESEYQKHLKEFEDSLKGAVAAKPVYINCHSGKDYFSFDQNKAFLEMTIKVSRDTGVPVYHETHRSRILYAAPVAKQFFQALPDARITLDISHWCNVHESYLQDQQDTVAMALQRTGHIHARIGHPEGPQVNDPRAPEWKDAVASHFAWWDQVVERKKREGATMTFLTEFGPVDYMPAIPYTRQPIADQWEINVHMLKTLRARYS